MKIESRGFSKDTKASRKDSSQASSRVRPLFESILKRQEAELEPVSDLDKLESELAELDELSKELLLRRSLGSLDAYKKKLGAIMSLLSQQTHQNLPLIGGEHSGAYKHLQLTRRVDESLVELQKNVMDGEKGNLMLAASIDNIKGLLLDFLR
ncbi:MAG: DUF327 family protein [Candidatus Cloacimonetes bacterium]|nr:DUF327 family protein [Candidatus Cloacimonadota bacterium]